MTDKTLRPSLTMSDVFGADLVYAPRAPDGFSDWMPPGALALDMLTGGQLSIAGDMPVVCSAGFCTSWGAEMMVLGGARVPGERVPYRAGQAHVANLKTLRNGERLVLQHAYPTGSLEAERCWIDPALLSWLNNKANLVEVAAKLNVPQRSIVQRAQFFASGGQKVPIVLKVVTNQSSGGGFGVAVCRTSEELVEAAERFAGCEEIVVEEPLDLIANPCVHFAVLSPDDVRYIGFADQVIGPDGRHQGNWVDFGATLEEPSVQVAREIVERAAKMGYRGFAGIDLAMDDRGGIFVLDLNFRVNASTAHVLLAPAIQDRLGSAGAMRSRKFMGSRGLGHLSATLNPFVEMGRVVALACFEPEAAGYAGVPPSVQALVIGASRLEVAAIEGELDRLLA